MKKRLPMFYTYRHVITWLYAPLAFANRRMHNNLDKIVYEGLTLRDIFETNNIVNDITKFIHANLTFSNGILSLTGDIALNETVMYYQTAFNATSANKIYYSLDAKTTVDTTNAIQLFLFGHSNPFVNINYILPNTKFETYSGFLDISVTGSYIPRLDNNNVNTNGVTDFINIFIINMSIFTVLPTQSQLDNLRDTYLNIKSREIKGRKDTDYWKTVEVEV